MNERLSVLQRTKEFLDHSFVTGHDDEIREGIDVALTKHLDLLVLKLSRCRCNSMVPIEDENQGALIQEVSSSLEALEMVYRASDPAVGDSFLKIGPDLLHVLVNVMDEELTRRGTQDPPNQPAKEEPKRIKQEEGEDEESKFNPIASDHSNSSETTDRPKHESSTSPTNAAKEDDDATPELQRPVTPLSVKMGSPEGNFLILKAIKVMGHLARVGKATKPMAFFPGLLRCLLNLINHQPHDGIPWEARLSALWILGNLACNPENMQMMMCTPGLVRCLVRVGCRALHADDPMEVTMEVLRSRSLSSRALLNLSWKPENKIPLSENLALVELLTQLAVHRKAPALNDSKTVQNILQQTRCHAVGGLRNLAAAPRRTKIQLCEYRNGHVLDALTDVALNDDDPGIVNRAFAAIHNLAVHDTATKMVERPALVLALKDVLLEDDQTAAGNQVVGKEGSPRTHAAATLLVLERTITPEMESYQNLRDLLDAINPEVPSEPDSGGGGRDDDDDEDDNDVKNVTAIEV
jgi:hypothetical protein